MAYVVTAWLPQTPAELDAIARRTAGHHGAGGPHRLGARPGGGPRRRLAVPARPRRRGRHRRHSGHAVIVAHVLAVVFGAVLVMAVLISALETVVLPRDGFTRIARVVFAVADRILVHPWQQQGPPRPTSVPSTPRSPWSACPWSGCSG